MKKIFLLIIILFLITGCNSKEEEKLMKSNNFDDIKIENVTSLEIIKYTIGGQEQSIIENQDDIIENYNYLNNFKIGNKTNKTCEDNTAIYNFKQNDKIISIEIECDNILVVDDERYELIK